MTYQKVSVIIPAYNQADFLGEAIQSTLTQTYDNFEIIVVNDASSDHTDEAVKQFDDPRIQYVIHEKNRGLPATRNTGIRASSGELIAFLDADDIFHPDKLQAHVNFLNNHPEIGVSYNNRFELNHSSKTTRELWSPPKSITLADLVLGFPYAPSDIVVRSKWVYDVGLFDENLTFFGEDLDMSCRLGLAGCKFGGIDRALNYRRYHTGRVIKDLAGGLQIKLQILDRTFSDPRCPGEVSDLREIAFANRYMVWAYRAFAQDETILGQQFIREAVRSNPSIIKGKPCDLVVSLLTNSIDDENESHERILLDVFRQLPSELSWLSDQRDWAVARGYLLRGTRAIIWNRPQDGLPHLSRAAKLGAQIDETILQQIANQLLKYEAEFGETAAQGVLKNLTHYLKPLGTRTNIRWLQGCYSINRAFRDYRTGHYSRVPIGVIRAISKDPAYLVNHGVISILARSLIGSMGTQKAEYSVRNIGL